MGFLGLIPADKLAASYDPQNKVLILYAEGKAKKYTTGIHFVQDLHFVGGLKFDLEGWTGPIGPGWQPYKIKGEFPLTLPSVVTPGKDVIIVTANYPGGHAVTIRWLGYIGDPPAPNPNVGDLSISDGEIPKQPPVTINGSNNIVAFWGQPFNIAAPAESNKYASTTMKYDNKYLLITNAANEDGLIVWTFDPTSIGTTQVIVTTIPPPPLIGIFQIWYTIEILGRETATIPKSLADGSEPSAPAEILSFKGRVFIAIHLVKIRWPDAELWWVEANLPIGVRPPTTDPNELLQLRAAFNVDKGTVIIDSKGWESWDNPVFYNHKLLGNVVVPFPVKFDIVEAYEILVEAGYSGKLSSAVLKHPLGPKGEPWDEEPYYVFQLFEGPAVFVGAENGSVWPPPPNQ